MAVNAKSVVDIEVNDKAFKDFMSMFEKYNKLLGRTPQAWASMSKEQKAMTQTFNQGIAALLAQNEAMRKMAAHAKDVSTHSEKTHHWWNKTYDRVAKAGAGIIHITEKLMKWGAILAGIATGTGIAGFFGLDKLGAFVRSGSIAGDRTGMSMGSLRSLEGHFGDNYGMDVKGMAQRSAQAAEDPQSDAAQVYRRMGLDPQNLKGTKRVTELMRAIRQKMKETGLSPAQLVDRYNLGSAGYGAEDVRVLGSKTDSEFEHDVKHTEKGATQLDMKKEEIAKWKEFMTSLDHASKQLQTILAKYLTPILDSFTKNSDQWLKDLDKFLDSPEMKKFINDVPGYLDQISSILGIAAEKFKRAFQYFGWLPYSESDLKRMKEEAEANKNKPGIVSVQKMSDKEYSDKTRQILDFFGLGSLMGPGNSTNTLGSHQSGTTIGGVNETGSYQLHKGEIVIPRNQAEILRGSGMGDWKRAISGIESGGNYGILNSRGSGASGKYQVMPANIGPWTKKVFGRAMSQAEFLNSPHAQERVFETIFGEYVTRFGNPVDAASAWFSGQPLTGNRAGPDAMGTSVPGYVQKFISALAGGGGGRMSLNINDNTGGNVALSAAALPSSTGPLPAFPL